MTAQENSKNHSARQRSTAYFMSGSAVVAEPYKQQLRALAQKAPVSNCLRQTGLIQPGRILPPSAMGEGTTAPGETAPTSDDEARRVVVRLVTSKTQLTQ